MRFSARHFQKLHIWGLNFFSTNFVCGFIFTKKMLTQFSFIWKYFTPPKLTQRFFFSPFFMTSIIYDYEINIRRRHICEHVRQLCMYQMKWLWTLSWCRLRSTFLWKLLSHWTHANGLKLAKCFLWCVILFLFSIFKKREKWKSVNLLWRLWENYFIFILTSLSFVKNISCRWCIYMAFRLCIKWNEKNINIECRERFLQGMGQKIF